MAIERNGTDDIDINYLDVKLKLSAGQVETSVFHKVEQFDFEVTTLFFAENCAPMRLGYNMFGGQIIRYGRICSTVEGFVQKTKKTVQLLISGGYYQNILKKQFIKTLHKHKPILNKYNIFTAEQLTCSIFA